MSCVLNAVVILVITSFHIHQSVANTVTAAPGEQTNTTNASEIGDEFEDDPTIIRFIQLKLLNDPLMVVLASYVWQPKSPAEWNFDEEGGKRFTSEGGKVEYDIIVAGVPVTLRVNAETVRGHPKLYKVEDSKVYDVSCTLQASFPYESIPNNYWMLRLSIKDKNRHPSSKRFSSFRKQITSNAPVLLNKTWKLKYIESLHRSMLTCSLYTSTMKLNKTITKGTFSDTKVLMTKSDDALDQAYMNNVRIGIILALAISVLLSMLSGFLYRRRRDLESSSVDTEQKEVGGNQTTNERSSLETSATIFPSVTSSQNN
ncbi:hypothetical protein HELRODRAFT_160376 [Helobdella robusta]|uniref:Uncharacterized protein n=1 Tax=Helobdella robusta TaxID=6412 RepID=T1EQ61_HELRO|nr:hypothetical protein HELRODRAFT_160376 [Helobdella robusta]ESO06218.1 hypothetical protein HELRODRAFT_160376 [Helobdella robusta]